MEVRPRVRGLALWLGLVGLFGLLLFAYHYLEVLASRGSKPMLEPLIDELTGAFVGGVLFFPARWLVRRLPLTRSTWPHRVPVYVLAILFLGSVATTLMWGLRSLLYPLAGLGRFDYGVMPLRYFMELPLQAIWLTVVFAAVHVYYALEAARARELRHAQLAGSLARAQLRNLRLQLQPHFLFNALNTISATMYEDPAAADEMLDQLAELLRASLRTAQSDEVPLGEELALLDRYLALMRARFGERLAVDLQLDPETATALVPSLLLQPLVENADPARQRRARGAGRHRRARPAGGGSIDPRSGGRRPGRREAQFGPPGAGPRSRRHGRASPAPLWRRPDLQRRQWQRRRLPRPCLPAVPFRGGCARVIRALIADDEEPARRKLRELLAREEDFEIVGEAVDGVEAVAAIHAADPDVAFLDVQMPRLDGFGVVGEVGIEAMPLVVFVTAYDEHALRAFEVHALDYLLKPFAPLALQKAPRSPPPPGGSERLRGWGSQAAHRATAGGRASLTRLSAADPGGA